MGFVRDILAPSNPGLANMLQPSTAPPPPPLPPPAPPIQGSASSAQAGQAARLAAAAAAGGTGTVMGSGDTVASSAQGAPKPAGDKQTLSGVS